MTVLLSTPREDGFFMPAEWTPQQQVWMAWPERPDNWRLGGKPAQAAFSLVAKTIAETTPVTVLVSAKQYGNACLHLAGKHIRVIEMSTDDAWLRDTGPTFVTNLAGDIRGVDWCFNAWGGLHGGLYFPWAEDDLVASKVLQVERLKSYHSANFVLEGGAIHVDGEGTLITTEECLLNSNRNPHLSREQIEHQLREYLGVSTIIWLKQGLYNDETDGHVDNFCCFVKPAEVVLAWTDNIDDPNYQRCRDAEHVLRNSTDAQGRSITVHRLQLPQAIYATAEECAGVDKALGTQARDPSIRLAGSYVNFLITNRAIIVPIFNDPADHQAVATLQMLFPDYVIKAVPGREILLGGGNIHCITQQQPLSAV